MLGSGYGLDDRVIATYHFLCHNYCPGDRISLFGFSGGAYMRLTPAARHTVRYSSCAERNPRRSTPRWQAIDPIWINQCLRPF
ncbi:MAG: phospholipase effector Tle1 domain-containing protein [Blastomonas fulva]|uniref:phospholipase effector Tle1 domain-containing protein n=1 Tax=Blastomonas fulva TaxID=1550728 RepID=UPI004033A0D5